MTTPAPTATTNVYGNNATVTAAVKIFDATAFNGPLTAWEVHVYNNDATATNLLYIGFDASVDATVGFPVKGQTEFIIYSLPPAATAVWAFASGARDVRVLAVPVLY